MLTAFRIGTQGEWYLAYAPWHHPDRFQLGARLLKGSKVYRVEAIEAYGDQDIYVDPERFSDRPQLCVTLVEVS